MKSLFRKKGKSFLVILSLFSLCVCSLFPVNADAASNKAVKIPVSFTGISYTEGAPDDWNKINDYAVMTGIEDSLTLTQQLSVRATFYIPKTALAKNDSLISFGSWADIFSSETGEWLGTIDTEHTGNVSIVKEGSKVVGHYWDISSQSEKPAGNYVTIKTEKAYYAVTITHPLETEVKNEEGIISPIDTSKPYLVAIGLSFSGEGTKFKDNIYLDNVTLLGNDATLAALDFSSSKPAWMEGNCHWGEDKNPVSIVTFPGTTLTLKKSSAAIKKGKTYTIKASATPAATITYKSSNTKIASVSNKGVVKGKKAGKATITVKANGITKKFVITVK